METRSAIEKKSRWLLICATKPEWSFLKSLFLFKKEERTYPHYVGEFGGNDIALSQVGVGLAVFRHVKPDALFDPPPDGVIHFGLSGALRPGLSTGDLILPDRVVNEEGKSLPIESSLFLKAQKTLGVLSLSHTIGSLLTATKVLETPLEKQEAGKHFGACAVDMETFPLLQMSAEKKIPFLSVRSIFDELDWDLTKLGDAHLLDEAGNISAGALAAGFVKNPRLIFSMPRYQRAAAKANKALALFLSHFLSSLKGAQL